jgi:hypothetical protein
MSAATGGMEEEVFFDFFFEGQLRRDSRHFG